MDEPTRPDATAPVAAALGASRAAGRADAIRRSGLRRSRWIATGAAIGTATLLTGVIAIADHRAEPGSSRDRVDEVDAVDGGVAGARPFDPSTASGSSGAASGASGASTTPHTRSGGS